MSDKDGKYDIVIVGGGIVGLACAYKIATNHPDLSIAVMEKEETLAFHQTGHNSGVIHSGLYYKPGSSKAKNCSKGRKELVRFAEKYNIPHEICGKVIVATAKRELPHLERIFENGCENEIEGIEKISAEKVKELEPSCEGIAGILVPCTGIIDYVKVAEKLADLIVENNNNRIFVDHKVLALDKHDFYTEVRTNQGSFSTKHVINCAGLNSDRIAKADGLWPDVRIIPFRGDYYELSENAKPKVKHLIYPVPDPSFPFLGVHFTRMINDTVECGPNAVFSFKREGYGKTDFDFADTVHGHGHDTTGNFGHFYGSNAL